MIYQLEIELAAGLVTQDEHGFVSPAGREDLIRVYTTDDTQLGWAPRSGLFQETPKFETTEEEIAWLRDWNSQIRYVDVYADDFVTVIGRFKVFDPNDVFTGEEVRELVHRSGIRLPENPTDDDYMEAFGRVSLVEFSANYYASREGRDTISLYEMRAEVETAGVKLPRSVTDFEIMKTYVQLKMKEEYAEQGIEVDFDYKTEHISF